MSSFNPYVAGYSSSPRSHARFSDHHRSANSLGGHLHRGSHPATLASCAGILRFNSFCALLIYLRPRGRSPLTNKWGMTMGRGCERSIFGPPSRALKNHLNTLLPSSGELAPQGEFSQLGTPLAECCFLVVDLETTGMGAGAEITEIAAARYYKRRLCGTFRSLVRTRRPIPPRIVALTGITNSMVLNAEPLAEVFPRFLAFWMEDRPDSPR